MIKVEVKNLVLKYPIKNINNYLFRAKVIKKIKNFFTKNKNDNQDTDMLNQEQQPNPVIQNSGAVQKENEGALLSEEVFDQEGSVDSDEA